MTETASWFTKGALIGVVGTLPLVALTGLVFRFPVPMVGYVSGPGAVFPAVIGALFYGVALGGFVVQAVLGGVGGVTGSRRGWPDPKRMWKLCTGYSLLAAEGGVVFLAVLDWVIGPW
jgi:hypothetical protein